MRVLQWSSCIKSPPTRLTFAPSFSSVALASLASSISSGRWEMVMLLQPSRANMMAAARPIPLSPPVIMAAFPASLSRAPSVDLAKSIEIQASLTFRFPHTHKGWVCPRRSKTRAWSARLRLCVKLIRAKRHVIVGSRVICLSKPGSFCSCLSGTATEYAVMISEADILRVCVK